MFIVSNTRQLKNLSTRGLIIIYHETVVGAVIFISIHAVSTQ